MSSGKRPRHDKGAHYVSKGGGWGKCTRDPSIWGAR